MKIGMKIKIVKDKFIYQKVIGDLNLCWASCISIASNKKLEFKDLVKKLDEYLVEDGEPSQNLLPSDKNYYYRFFNDDELFLKTEQGCSQYQLSKFPIPDFVIDKIKKDKAIIFSGINFPFINNKHAIVVTGYKKDPINDIFWILGLDPVIGQYPLKTALVYHNFIEYNNLFNLQNMDFVSNFGEKKSKRNKIIYSDNDNFKNFEYFKNYRSIDSLELAKTFISELISGKREMFEDFFDTETISNLEMDFLNAPKTIKESKDYMALNYGLNENVITNPNRCYLYPIYNNLKQILFEVIFWEKEDNKLTLLGVRKPEIKPNA